MPDDAVAVGVDVGGTKIAGVSLTADGAVVSRRRVDSPTGDGAAVVTAVAGLARQLAPEAGLPLGVGFAGIIDRDGVVAYGPNVAVTDLPLRERLHAELGVPVTVVNDASAAAWGERCAGAGRGVDDLILLTLGTGVGGGVVVDSRLVEGASGFAGELGHIVVDDGGRRCPCGNRGCLEAYASGTAVEAMVRDRLARDETASHLEGPAPTGREIAAAADAHDPVATAVLRRAGHWLGVAVASLVNALDPATVVIGGGAATGFGPHLLPVARRVAADRIMGAAHRPPVRIVEAALGNEAGAVGAGLLAAHRDGAS